jgi:hypothetical protein
MIAAPQTHFAFFPANCGFHAYCLPQAAHENLPPTTSDCCAMT